MRPEAYSAILYALAECIHPITGDSLPDGLIDQPDVIRELFAGARMLEIAWQDGEAGYHRTGTDVKGAGRSEPGGDRQEIG